MPIHLSMAQLEPLIMESPFLDEVEQALRLAGEISIADNLLALQRDVGADYQCSFGGFNDPPPGPQTAALERDYEEVTPERFNKNLKSALDALDRRSPLYDRFKNLVQDISITSDISQTPDVTTHQLEELQSVKESRPVKKLKPEQSSLLREVIKALGEQHKNETAFNLVALRNNIEKGQTVMSEDFTGAMLDAYGLLPEGALRQNFKALIEEVSATGAKAPQAQKPQRKRPTQGEGFGL